MTNVRPAVSFGIDALDVIDVVNDEFVLVALEVGAPELADRRAMLGKKIWTFIRGHSTQSIYAAIIKTVRLRQREFRVSFRCDTPHLIRDLIMRVSPAANGGVGFET